MFCSFFDYSCKSAWFVIDLKTGIVHCSEIFFFSVNFMVYYCCCLVTKSCPTLFNSMDCSPPGSSVHGIFQARILEWVAISFSMGSSNPHLLHWQVGSLPLSHQRSPQGTRLGLETPRLPSGFQQSILKTAWGRGIPGYVISLCTILWLADGEVAV